MNELIIDLTALSVDELQRATEKHGPAFHSLHEAHNVIREEYEEAEENSDHFNRLFQVAWDSIKADNRDHALNMLGYCRERAIEAAMEWIQVAAVCHKAQRKWEDGDV